jgi:hypothetical protein
VRRVLQSARAMSDRIIQIFYHDNDKIPTSIPCFYKHIQKLYSCQNVDSRAFASPVIEFLSLPETTCLDLQKAVMTYSDFSQ